MSGVHVDAMTQQQRDAEQQVKFARIEPKHGCRKPPKRKENERDDEEER